MRQWRITLPSVLLTKCPKCNGPTKRLFRVTLDQLVDICLLCGWSYVQTLTRAVWLRQLQKERILPKDIEMMQGDMNSAGYHYCKDHDIYYDEWLECPVCAINFLVVLKKDTIKKLRREHEQFSRITAKFNPKDRS